jgi:hypothetical protein
VHHGAYGLARVECWQGAADEGQLVTGETVALRATFAIVCQSRSSISAISGGGSPNASASHAQAIRHGSRIAAVPPGIRTGHSVAARVKPCRSPTRISPPQTVASVP